MPDETPEAHRLSSGYVRVAWSREAWCQFVPDHAPTPDEFFNAAWSYTDKRAAEAFALAQEKLANA